MKITLNGQAKELSSTPNLNNIIGQFCKNKNPVIAELNGKIIKTPQWEKTIVKEGDTIELVSFVGGGSLVVVKTNTHEQRPTNNKYHGN